MGEGGMRGQSRLARGTRSGTDQQWVQHRAGGAYSLLWSLKQELKMATKERSPDLVPEVDRDDVRPASKQQGDEVRRITRRR